MKIYTCIEIAELEILAVRTFAGPLVAREWFDSVCYHNSLAAWDADELYPNVGPGLCYSPMFAAGDDVYAALVYVTDVETSV